MKRVLNKYKENPQDRLPYHFIALSGIIASGPTALVAVKYPNIHRHQYNMQEFESKSKRKIISYITDHLMLEQRLLNEMDLVDYIGDFSRLGEERLLVRLRILLLINLL